MNSVALSHNNEMKQLFPCYENNKHLKKTVDGHEDLVRLRILLSVIVR